VAAKAVYLKLPFKDRGNCARAPEIVRFRTGMNEWADPAPAERLGEAEKPQGLVHDARRNPRIPHDMGLLP
jgi:hypothetical protein